MPTSAEAEEHLRVIRSLMEKATIYRAISAPSALVGGLLAICVSATLVFLQRDSLADPKPALFYFSIPWLVVLFVVSTVNLFHLWRDAGRRGDPFFSSGMRLALRALSPGFLVAGMFTAFLSLESELQAPLAAIWVLTYGLALLATSDFAPRSISLLGWAFLTCGLALVVAFFSVNEMTFFSEPGRSANLIMGATFGLFHLIYAACTWPRRAKP